MRPTTGTVNITEGKGRKETMKRTDESSKKGRLKEKLSALPADVSHIPRWTMAGKEGARSSRRVNTKYGCVDKFDGSPVKIVLLRKKQNRESSK